MVRHGNSEIAPGCISMEEAILLHQALSGGPSGPGTGITSQLGQQPSNIMPPFPQDSVMTPIPGMNFLGGTGPEPRGFEQRFEQGLGRAPSSFVNPLNIPGQTGLRMPGQRQFGTGFPNSQRPIGFSNSGFLDPLSGQLAGPPGVGMPGQGVGMPGQGVGMPGQGFGIGQRIDGGNNLSRHALASKTNSLGNTNRQPNLDSGGGGGGRVTNRGNDGFPGEEFLANQNSNAGRNTLFHKMSPSNLDFLQARQTQVNGDVNVTQTSRPERQGQVSRIMEDSMGLHFLFYPTPNYPGIRVNITKDGFCRRDIMTRERNLCMNTCYSDKQCPRDLKCCPSGCSLGCIAPSLPGEDNGITTRVASVRNESPQGCRRGNSWCPQGYICMNVRNSSSGNYEDRCVLPRTRRLPPLYRTIVTGQSPKQPERSISHLTVIPMVNKDKQSAIMGIIQPGLVKQESVRIQQLNPNPTREDRNMTLHDNRLTQSQAAIPSTTFLLQTSTPPYVVVRRTLTASTSHACIPCNDHADCNDLFTYCINKVPCMSKVCHRVT